MKTLELQQGSDAWRHHRATHHNASEAPAMMGASEHLKRNDLVKMKATGTEKQYCQWVEEVLFKNGHAVEALARPIVEKMLGEELFPTTGESDDHPDLSASFDGITMDESTVWECKQWNATKARIVRESQTIPDEDRWQCAQQLVVSRASRLIYTVSDGTEDNTVHCEFRLRPDDEKKLLAGWKQFDADVAAYKPQAVTEAPAGRAIEGLPALLIQVTGTVMASNLPEYKARAIEVFRSINTNLSTDADFADAEQAVKFCKDIEERLDQAKQHALSQTASIDALFKSIDAIAAEARNKRLELDKLVKSRKESVRGEIIRAGVIALAEHIAKLNKRLARVSLPASVGHADFHGVIRGLKTFTSIRNAVDTELARAKIEASQLADDYAANLATIDVIAKDHQFLLRDLRDLVTINPEHISGVLKGRIAEYDAEQKRRTEQEAARKAAADLERDITREQPAATGGNGRPPVGAGGGGGSVTTVTVTAPKPRLRSDGPTAAQVVAVVAGHYGVPNGTAAEWLARLDFKARSAA